MIYDSNFMFEADISYTLAEYPNNKFSRYYTDGTKVEGSLTYSNQRQFDTLLNTWYRQANENGKQIAFVVWQSGIHNACIIVPSNVDFIYISSISAPSVTYSIEAYEINYSSATSTNGTLTLSDDYLNIGINGSSQQFNLFNDYSYTYYQTSLGNGDKLVYDFNYLYEDVIRETKNGFRYHNHVLLVDDLYSSLDLHIGLGNPYQYVRDTSYTEGFSKGEAKGQEEGYQQGLKDGTNIGPVGSETATAFTYISGAFSSLSNILELEVLPHVTLGICFSIPVVLVLIMTIFKLVRK